MSAERKITMVTRVTVTRADAERIAVMAVLLHMFINRDRPGWHQPAPISLERVRHYVRRSVAKNGPSAGGVADRSAAALSERLPSVGGKRPTAGLAEAVKGPVAAAFTWSAEGDGEPATTLHIKREVSRAEAEVILTARVLQWMVNDKNAGLKQWYKFPWRLMNKRATRSYVKLAYRDHGDQAPARAAEQVKTLTEALSGFPTTPGHVAELAAARVGRAWDWSVPDVAPAGDDEPALQ